MSDDDESDVAEPDETIIKQVEPSVDAETEFNPFDEVYEDYQPGPLSRVMGPDGLPQAVDQTGPSDIPKLSKDTLVCMGDFSKFVMRDEWGRVTAEFEPAEVARMPDGNWTVPVELAVARGGSNVVSSGLEVVDPIRPPCRHYVRQLGSFDKNPKNQKIYRLCSARRTTEGTFMSVSDIGMWACDMREPYDVDSVRHIDDFDTTKMEQGRTRVHVPMFQGFGIFETPKSESKES